MTTNNVTTTKTRSRKNINTIADASNVVASIPQVNDSVRKLQDQANEEAANLSMDKVAQSLTKAGLDISKAINGVKDIFESQISQLSTLKSAIESKQDELDLLYGKEVVAKTLQQLLAEHEKTKLEISNYQDAVKQAWAKEHDTYNAAVIESKLTLEKNQKREQEEYSYKVKQARAQDEDNYKQAVLKRERERAEIENKLSERETKIKAVEAEVLAGKAKLDSFETVVEAAVVERSRKILEEMGRNHANDIKFLKLNQESEKKLLDQAKQSLVDTLTSKDKEIVELRVNVNSLQKEIREISLASINSQSGKAALEAVQNTITNQNSKQSKI